MRKLMFAYALSFLMSPVPGWAFGMGDIQVNSHLNQPLNAELELYTTNTKDLEQLQVTLAPPKAFLRAGIEYSHYLSQFNFALVQHNSKNYIAITTNKPFKVPLASFLIDVNWGNGHLIREYTILLDPPEFITKQSHSVNAEKVISR